MDLVLLLVKWKKHCIQTKLLIALWVDAKSLMDRSPVLCTMCWNLRVYFTVLNNLFARLANIVANSVCFDHLLCCCYCDRCCPKFCCKHKQSNSKQVSSSIISYSGIPESGTELAVLQLDRREHDYVIVGECEWANKCVRSFIIFV